MPAKAEKQPGQTSVDKPETAAPAIAMRDSSLPTPHVLLSNEGMHVSVAGDVLGKIIGLAVREVPGVHALAPHGAGDRLVALADRVTGSQHQELGVHVEIGTVECAADINIICDYGSAIPAVAEAIRKTVTTRVKTMTGLEVRELNIEVVDLFFSQSERKVGRQLR